MTVGASHATATTDDCTLTTNGNTVTLEECRTVDVQRMKTETKRRLDRTGRALARFARFERVLATVCIGAPLAMIAADDEAAIRDSISAYYAMGESQWFYFPLTVAATMFVVNGVIKHRRLHNVALGVALCGVVLFDKDADQVIHFASAAVFFLGNVVVMVVASRVDRWLRTILAGLVVLALVVWAVEDSFTLFWAEWVSLAAIAFHYAADSIPVIPYRAR